MMQAILPEFVAYPQHLHALLGSSGRFAPFEALLALTVRAADGDERHGPFLSKGGYEDEAQCDMPLSPSPLLKHYPWRGTMSRPADIASTLPASGAASSHRKGTYRILPKVTRATG